MKDEHEEKETPEEEKKELLDEAKERFKLAEEAWSDNRKAALEDMRFYALDHWPEDVKKVREGRPCLVVDKLGQYVRQVINDGRQNRPTVKVRPVDDGADKETAEVFQGIIRHIWDRSNADEAVDSALENAVVGGFGFFRVLTDYAHEGTFNQEIEIGRIRNPMSVLIDPNASKADGSDIRWAFFIDEIPRDDFKEQYKDAEFTDWDSDGEKYSDGWLDEENVRVAEYFYREEVKKTLHLLADGTTIEDELYQRAVKEGVPTPEIIDTREIPSHTVKWCRLSGAEVLEEQDWPGKYIPIIPVYGNEYDIEGKVTYSGLIRAAKDPQRLYNYSRSAFAERVALTPKSPYIAAEGQVDEYYDEWSRANTDNLAVLRYSPVSIDNTPVPPPMRQPAADIPSGFAQEMQLSEHDIQSSMGMYSETVLGIGNANSGKQELLQQRRGDTATFHYQDNLSRAIRHLGRILVDLIPKIYDSSRIVRILGEDGTAEMAQIDPTQDVAIQKIGSKAIYNLNVGTYDVSVSAGPSYNTKRQEAADSMIQITQARPELMNVIGDLMIRNMDWPGADEIADRLKMLLPPQILQAEQQDQEIPPQLQATLTQMQQAIAERDQVMQQMNAQLQQSQDKVRRMENDASIDAAEVDVKRREAEIKAFDAETKRLQPLSQAITPDQIQALVVQTIQNLLMSPDISPPPQQPIQQEPPQGGFFVPEESL